MKTTNRYPLLIEALTELAPEIRAALPARRRQTPALSEVLASQGPLPDEALFLGMAGDGMPVLLNLLDPVPGPLMIAGDEGTGKTDFLHMIAGSVNRLHAKQDVQYGIVTAHPEEWQDAGDAQNCVDIFPSYEQGAAEFLESLTAWAHSNHGETQSVLLLVDDLNVITRMDHSARQNLRWLLLRGPARRVWPIITLNAKNTEAVRAWLEFFRTRFFGTIRDENQLRHLSGSADETLKGLHPGLEFAMREGTGWLKFWLPSLD